MEQKPVGIDTWDPCLYDLVIHIKFRVDDAVEIIKCALKGSCFSPPPNPKGWWSVVPGGPGGSHPGPGRYPA